MKTHRERTEKAVLYLHFPNLSYSIKREQFPILLGGVIFLIYSVTVTN